MNREITAREVRVVQADGTLVGVLPIREALEMADEQKVDLVEISPNAAPPVCRLVDYGKFKYQEAKKAHEAKLKQKTIQMKEIKFRPSTGEADYQVKLRALVRFLSAGDKAKVTLRFRGRELAHQEQGIRVLDRIRKDLEEYGQIEKNTKLDGRQLVAIFIPLKTK